MKRSEIKVGHWYQTTKGVGQCLRTDATYPPSVQFRINWPVPRGTQHLTPREVLSEVPAPPGTTPQDPGTPRRDSQS